MSDEHAAVDDLASGYFGKEVLATTETPSAEDTPAEDLVGDLPPVDGAAPAATPATPAAEEPKTHTLTADEYARVMGTTTALEELRADMGSKFDKAFGQIGGAQQVLKALQAAVPKGGEIPKVTKDDLGKLVENYEYLGDDMVDAFNNVLGKIKGTGGSSVDPVAIASLVQDGVKHALPQLAEEIEHKLEIKAVKKVHPDAEDIFKDSGFHKWMKENNREDSWDSTVMIPTITDYKKFKAPPPPAAKKDTPPPPSRKELLRDNINPASSAGGVRPTPEKDEFLQGYNETKS